MLFTLFVVLHVKAILSANELQSVFTGKPFQKGRGNQHIYATTMCYNNLRQFCIDKKSKLTAVCAYAVLMRSSWSTTYNKVTKVGTGRRQFKVGNY